jgi:hypothetical protein
MGGEDLEFQCISCWIICIALGFLVFSVFLDWELKSLIFA